MPIYEFYCDGCGCVENVLRPVSECANGYGCFNCGAPMARVYSPPAVMNRQKPGTFKFDPAAMTPWDSRLAAMRLSESQGVESARQAKTNMGKMWDLTLKYKREKYG